MRNPVRSSQFKRDVKKAEKRGKQMSKLRALIGTALVIGLLNIHFHEVYHRFV